MLPIPRPLPRVAQWLQLSVRKRHAALHLVRLGFILYYRQE
jgi:hypothetical protein